MKKLISKKFFLGVAIIATIFVGIFVKAIPPAIGIPAVVTLAGWYMQKDNEDKKENGQVY